MSEEKGYYSHGDYMGYNPDTNEYERFETEEAYHEWYIENFENTEE